MEVIEILHIGNLKYANVDYDVEKDFLKIFTNCWTQIDAKIKRQQNLLKYITFDISIITLVYLLIYEEEYWSFKKL